MNKQNRLILLLEEKAALELNHKSITDEIADIIEDIKQVSSFAVSHNGACYVIQKEVIQSVGTYIWQGHKTQFSDEWVIDDIRCTAVKTDIKFLN